MIDLTNVITTLARAGSGWVLYLLIACSVVSIAVIIDRVLFWSVLAFQDARGRRGPERRMAQVAEEARPEGPERLRAALYGQRLQERVEAERGLVVLGTLGNNAPFIGLFGTVLGIVRAFHDLGNSAAQGPAAVMAGISEALVATAVGILVAIPAVIAFNLLTRRVRVLDYRLDGLTETLAATPAPAVPAPSPAQAGMVSHALGD